MRYVIIDLEATCWEGVRHSPKMAIIEIGAVCLASHGGPVEGEFGGYVRPVLEPTLSDFCRHLTSIRQEDVDGAELFGPVLGRFNAWLGPEPYVPCSWGAYDLHQLQHDCQQHGVPLPVAFAGHINLKKEFARLRGVKSCGMRKALEIAGIPLTGTHHRALDDARNIAKLALLILPLLETEGATMPGQAPLTSEEESSSSECHQRQP